MGLPRKLTEIQITMQQVYWSAVGSHLESVEGRGGSKSGQRLKSSCDAFGIKGGLSQLWGVLQKR